jgi:hypothetical protein
MEATIPAYAKTSSDQLTSAHSRRSAEPTARPAQTQPPRSLQPARRPLGRLFRRPTPTTFHRCLAVHIHYAQRASALD